MSTQQARSYSRTLINCRKITLARRNSPNRQTIADKGVILRSENGKLYLQLDNVVQDSISFSLQENRGRVVCDSEYYKFTAVDEVGRTWTVEKALLLESRLTLSAASDSKYKFEVCSGCVHVDNLVKAGDILTKTECTLTLLINEELKLPSPWKWQIKSGFSVTHTFPNGHEISISKGVVFENDVSLYIQYCFKDSENPVNIAHSLCESMQFILAQRVSWFYLERCIEGRTDIYIQPSSRRVSYNAGRAKPPIQLDRVCSDYEQQFYSASTDLEICSESQIWSLYEKYFRFISKNKTTPELHHLSGWVGRLIEIDQQSLEAELLTVSVAVESIVNNKDYSVLRQKRKHIKDKGNLKDKVKQLRLWLKAMEFDKDEDSFYRRIDGFLPSLLTDKSTPKDILLGLVQSRLLSKILYDSWNNVRNKAAHGHIVKPNKVGFYVKECDKVNLLFFHLIFLVIGYEGPFSDYSQDRWPTERFQSQLSDRDG